MKIGDIVRISANWRDVYPPYYRTMVALVVYCDSGYANERPVGFRRIKLMHGEIKGQIYTVFAEDVLEVVCSNSK